ncbi:MAG: hypothetical protein LKJ13_08075 [Clostridia bacterium]|jgi:cell division protein FtsI/penicillin-binding protein 2|nr:hypothetical protein [Clostridia bacterium]MCI1999943.1 hypothetical protein [Clostridia bacterium]MCI2014523.1 hypothetical protein [Clostridia bacterium]
MKSFFERVTEFVKSRVFLLLVGIFILFSAISIRLFYLQIINGEKYQQELKTSVMQNLSIPASRGMIYDRYGRPLATNEAAFSITIDDSVNAVLNNKNQALYEFVTHYDENDKTVSDDLPITKGSTKNFTISGDNLTKWMKKIGLTKKQYNMTAGEVYNWLIKKYDIPDGTSEIMTRKILSLGTSASDKNLMLMLLIQILDDNGQKIYDDLPISSSEPYTFKFDGNKTKEISWKKSVAMQEDQYNYDAKQTTDYLYDLFDIPSNISETMKRKAVAVRYSLYLKRYKKYQPVTVAVNISQKTLAAVEEKNDFFPGVSIDTDSLRDYPNGKYFSNIIGYISKISDSEYEKYKDYGYSQNDIVGKTGVEQLYELKLNGTDGESLVEVDASGRRINTIETKAPVSGDNVFLTIDKKLQVASYDYLEGALSETLIRKLQGTSSKDNPISLKELFTSMVNCNSISLKKICQSTDGIQKNIRDMIYSQYPDFDLSKDGASDKAKLIITNAIENGTISSKDCVVLLAEQGIISADSDYMAKIKSGSVSPLSVIIDKLRSKELHPSQTNLDPCTGSVVVSNVNTGEVLALVTYPSYDNNKLVNNFDSDYYTQLINDPTTPLVDRPLKQKKAPGSTFKMVTATAALETGVITPSKIVKTLGLFTKAGIPYARCWIYTNSHSTHGSINISQALEVSCNYFFYEMGYRLGNSSNGTTLQGIKTLDKYMAAYGLDKVTGIELDESAPNMASPEYKEEVMKWQNPDATSSQTRWTDGDTIRAAIGQSVNNFTPASMTKYVATLANGGTKYQFHVIDKVETPDSKVIEKKDPIIEEKLSIQPQNLEAIHKGMLLVTQGSKGTLRKVFKDFPIDVAAKSGTAQENLQRASHTWLVSFAPYENPQIAVTVMIPFGESSYSPAAIVAKNIIAEYMGLNYTPKNNYMDNVLAQ